MFTGIIESLGEIYSLKKEGENLNICVKSSLSEELKIDQSVAHNGVCLTVVAVQDDRYTVTAIKETLEKTNLSDLKKGDVVNIERARLIGDRLDGHIVQGHVDTVGNCVSLKQEDGSWVFTFEYTRDRKEYITVEKGSICINGISLTVVNSTESGFSVAIIPYTYEHTNLKFINTGKLVNLEFDIIGKYLYNLSIPFQK